MQTRTSPVSGNDVKHHSFEHVLLQRVSASYVFCELECWNAVEHNSFEHMVFQQASTSDVFCELECCKTQKI